MNYIYTDNLTLATWSWRGVKCFFFWPILHSSIVKSNSVINPFNSFIYIYISFLPLKFNTVLFMLVILIYISAINDINYKIWLLK